MKGQTLNNLQRLLQNEKESKHSKKNSSTFHKAKSLNTKRHKKLMCNEVKKSIRKPVIIDSKVQKLSSKD